MNNGRCYSELIRLPTFEERLKYLQIKARIGDMTFGGRRLLNQEFYRSKAWRNFRDGIIVRDGGCDLACPDYPLEFYLIVHHIIPITIEELINHDFSMVLNPENAILTSDKTHKAIHYGQSNGQFKIVERYPFDTCPWRNIANKQI